MQIVTISASFGAGGSVVGPAVAERLGIPFIDRAIPIAVARSLAVPLDEALDRDERRPSFFERIIASMAAAGTSMIGPTAVMGTITNEDDFRAATERVLRELATGGGVVLGRAGAVVLAKHRFALHVRLDGPRERRIERVMSHEQTDVDSATRVLDETDRAWESYVRFFYKTDPRDPRLYHLIIDSTALPLDACTELIVSAARYVAGTGLG
ncbi:MAG TPA: cytidylate kinase-like family protein [Acidimicrobiales bacterium]|nr:cytidylate kinase-like family protein [Acidimicrobiales bacterium]